MKKVFASAYRFPTYTTERVFLEIFNLSPLSFDTMDQIKEKVSGAKKKNYDYFLGKNVSDLFVNYPKLVILCLSDCTRLLKLNNKKFVPVSPQVSGSDLPTQTSSGFPDYIRPKINNLPYVISLAVLSLNTLDFSWEFYPTTMAWRSQVRKTGVKFRIIWVVSQLVHVFENMFFKPFKDHFYSIKDSAYCFANTFEDLSPRISKSREFVTIWSVDFSSFDQTVHPAMISLFFSWLKTHLDIKNSAFNQAFEAVARFNTKGFVFLHNHVNDPVFIEKYGSVFSGSVFTNFMDTFINLFVVCFCLRKMGIDPSNCFLNAMGDDNLICLPVEANLEEFCSLVFKHFGMIITPEKCDVYNPDFSTISFLGADMDEFGRYMDEELIKKQLATSTSYINLDLMSEQDRIFSKLASACFKYKNGYRFYDKVSLKLLKYYSLESIPEFYVELFNSNSGPFDLKPIRRVVDYKFNGWKLQ